MLDLKFQTMQTQLEERFDQLQEAVARVETQTTKTNGKVADAFIQIEAGKKFNWKITGALVLGMATLLPIMGFTLLRVWDTPAVTQGQIKNAVQLGVSQALVNYEVTNQK